MCVCVCVCVLDGEGSWVFASTALVVVWTARCVTGYSEPLKSSYRCHTRLKKMSSTISVVTAIVLCPFICGKMTLTLFQGYRAFKM